MSWQTFLRYGKPGTTAIPLSLSTTSIAGVPKGSPSGRTISWKAKDTTGNFAACVTSSGRFEHATGRVSRKSRGELLSFLEYQAAVLNVLRQIVVRIVTDKEFDEARYGILKRLEVLERGATKFVATVGTDSRLEGTLDEVHQHSRSCGPSFSSRRLSRFLSAILAPPGHWRHTRPSPEFQSVPPSCPSLQVNTRPGPRLPPPIPSPEPPARPATVRCPRPGRTDRHLRRGRSLRPRPLPNSGAASRLLPPSPGLRFAGPARPCL